MRDYGRVPTTFWTGEGRKLSDDGKTMMPYLMSCPHSNAIGCYRLPDAYIADDLNWSLERVRQTVMETVSIGLIERDNERSWIRVVNHFEYNSVDNPNVGKHCVPLVEAVPKESPLFQAVIDSLKPFSERFPEPFRNRYLNSLETESSSSSKNSNKKNAAAKGESVDTREGTKPPNGQKALNLQNYDAAAACAAAVMRIKLTPADEAVLIGWCNRGYDIEKDVLPVLVAKTESVMQKNRPMPSHPLSCWIDEVNKAAERRRKSEVSH